MVCNICTVCTMLSLRHSLLLTVEPVPTMVAVETVAVHRKSLRTTDRIMIG